MGKLPAYISRETSRHGKVIFYFRRRKGEPRIRLPSPGSPDFESAYEAAFSGASPTPTPPKPHAEEIRRLSVLVALRNAIRQARNRARRKGVPFDLTDEWVIAQAVEQQFRCVLSGIPFYREFKGRVKHHPYAPSLDRIEPSKGYVVGNVRIVIFALNMAMSDWGEAVVRDAFKKTLTPQRHPIRPHRELTH